MTTKSALFYSKYTMNGCGPDELVETLEQLGRRPRIIGHSSTRRREDFAVLGVNEFVLEPLNVEQSMASLAER